MDDADADAGRSQGARAFNPSAFVRLTVAAHGVGAATLAVAPGRWAWVGTALLVNHVAIGAAAVLPRSRLLGPNLARLPAAADTIGLTFDDGPDPVVTPKVLDLLEEHRATATFFCIGNRVLRFPEIAAAIVARGHTVANHSHTHPNAFAFYGPRAVLREVRSAQQAILAATGRRPTLFRAPVGIRGPFLEPCLAREGLSLVSWSRRGLDTVSRDPPVVVARLTRQVASGDILLLHDGSSAKDDAGRPVVLEALPRLLEALAARGLLARSIPEAPASVRGEAVFE
jgi:peptidoglycan-N-acetylglucosamine deacetylase